MTSNRPQSTLSAFFGSIGRSNAAASSSAEALRSDEEAVQPPQTGGSYGATAQGQQTGNATGAADTDADADGAAAATAAPAHSSAPGAAAPTSTFGARSRTFFKRKRPDPYEAWLQSRRPPFRRKRVRALFGLGVLLLILSLATALLLLLNLFAPIPALVPTSNAPGTQSLWFALSAAFIVAPSLLVFELSSKATHAVHSTSTGILALALLLILAITPLRQSETLLCAPTISLALIACAWALLSSSVVGRLQVGYALKAPPGIFIPTGEHPLPPQDEHEAGRAEAGIASGHANDDPEVSDERTPLLTTYTTSVQKRAQRGWRRVVKLVLAVLGTLTISVLIGLQTFNLLLTGTDAGLHPVGDRVYIDPRQAAAAQLGARLRTQSRDADQHNDTGIEIPPLPAPDWFMNLPPFNLHVACESSPPHTGHEGEGSKPSRPTAIFFTERGVSGSIGANWVRDMVRRAADGDEYGNGGRGGTGGGNGGDNATDDGHLSLEKVCFFDRLGHGHSDYMGGEEGVASVRLHTLALYAALGKLGVLNGSYPLDPDRPVNKSISVNTAGAISLRRWTQQTAWRWPWRQRKQDTAPSSPTKPPPKPDPSSSGNHTHSPNGTSPPFMLIAQGYGALHARHFAATFPTLIHSLLYVDAETPTSFYSDAVSARSGLRAGYGAWGHGWGLDTLGFVVHDILPALLEPLGVVRLAGLVLLGRRAQDRVLAPRGRGGARKLDAGGGGFRLFGAGGANGKLLATSLAERLDANRGTGTPSDDEEEKREGGLSRERSAAAQRLGGSRNYHELTRPEIIDAHANELAKRPTAVLSSFWKIHTDVKNWAEIQRTELVRDAKEREGLVGWWRLGSPLRPGSGGDGGEAEGICAEPLGRIYCEEAVRKLLAQGDLDERHRREGKKDEVSNAGGATTETHSQLRVFDESDDLDPQKPWPRAQGSTSVV
ncbi:hypothetical protein V8E36_000718 [Tilletia maclaganii]